jgi:N6-L-threonylcarbamoyladenine synthase
MDITILGIESSCDDTSAAVLKNQYVLSNIVANQEVHKTYGGVVPELASRAHQQNIIPVVDTALKKAGIEKKDLHAIAFTRGPGLMGSLLVGASFAKAMALSLNIPLIEVNHLQAHILVPFIKEAEKNGPEIRFPFLCLLVSGGHTQLVVVHDHLKMEIIGNTLDDAAGEAFDKCAKIIGFAYPGGPRIDKLSALGNPNAFAFPKPSLNGLNYSFSGLKTAFLYFIRDAYKNNNQFIDNNLNDICASIQKTIIDILMEKLILASQQTGIKEIAIGGGVSANMGLRDRLIYEGKTRDWKVFIPEFRYTTDNAAMIAITGHFKYLQKDFAQQDVAPMARLKY